MLLFVIVFVLPPIFFVRVHPDSPSLNCQSQLKQIGLGFKQYIQDYDEKYPIVASNNVAQSLVPYTKPFGWADAIQPYLKSTQIYQCPAETNGPNPNADATQQHFTDYWFNSRMANLGEAKLAYISNTVMLGDGNDGQDATNARYSLSKLPAAWLSDSKSPAFRHLDGANFCFADGHVKWLKADTSPRGAGPGPNVFTFAVR